MTRKAGTEPNSARLLRYLRGQGPIITATSLDLAAALNCHHDTIDVALSELRQAGLIETQRIGRNRIIRVKR